MADSVPLTNTRTRQGAPRGFYLAAEVSQLAGVSGNTVGQWKRRGYINASQSTDSYPNIYAYQDVAEAMVVHELLDNDVPLKSIRKLIRELRSEHGYDWPLQSATLYVPEEESPTGKSPVVVGEGEDRFDVTERAMTWHHVMDPGNLRLIAEQLHRGGWAIRIAPELRHIEVDPDKMSGRPSIRGLRIAAEDVARMATESGSDLLKEDYGLKVAQIVDAKKWWNVVQEFDEAA